MTFKNNRTPLLFYLKLCASFRSNWWILTGVTVRKRPNRLCNVRLTITSGDVTDNGVGIVTALAFLLIMQCRYTMCFCGIISSEYRKYAPRLARKGEVRGVFCGFIIWSVLWLSHLVLFSILRYIQPIRAIFDRDIMRASGIYISEMICHILVIWRCQQHSV